MQGLLTATETNNILCCCATLHQKALIQLVLRRRKQLHGEKLMTALLGDLPSIMPYMWAIQPAGFAVKSGTVPSCQALRISSLSKGALSLHNGAPHRRYTETASNYECPSCRRPALFGRTCCDQCRRSSGTHHHRDCIYALLHYHWSRRACSSSSTTPNLETSAETARHNAQGYKGIDAGSAAAATWAARPPHEVELPPASLECMIDGRQPRTPELAASTFLPLIPALAPPSGLNV